MFKNKSVEFRAAVKTAGVFGLLTVCGLLAAGFLELFGITALLCAICAFIVYQLVGMVYNSYLYSAKYENENKTKNG